MDSKIYIAGKVTGLPVWEYKHLFFQAEKKWMERGYEVLLPVRLVADSETDWKTAMKICIHALLDADAVYMLSNWKDSKGAILEHHIAEQLEKNIIYEDSFADQCLTNITAVQPNHGEELPGD